MKPQNSRVMHKQKSCYVEFSKEGRIGSGASHWPRITEIARCLPGWATEPMFQQSPYDLAFFSFPWDMSGDVSLRGIFVIQQSTTTLAGVTTTTVVVY